MDSQTPGWLREVRAVKANTALEKPHSIKWDPAVKRIGMVSLDLEELTPLHWVGIVAALVTAGVHLVLAFDTGGTYGALFLVAAAGFLFGVAAMLVGWRRRSLYLLGTLFTAGQIVWWYAANDVPPVSPAEGIDKAVQAVFVVVLAVLYYRESRNAEGLL